jgi:hypothetical protein
MPLDDFLRNVLGGVPADPEHDADARRLGYLEVSLDLILDLMKPGQHLYEVVEHALPDDAKIVRTNMNHRRDAVVLTLWSSMFASLAPGSVLPQLYSPICRHIQGEVVAIDRLPCNGPPGVN